jgi:hypothetical protein
MFTATTGHASREIERPAHRVDQPRPVSVPAEPAFLTEDGVGGPGCAQDLTDRPFSLDVGRRREVAGLLLDAGHRRSELSVNNGGTGPRGVDGEFGIRDHHASTG